MIRQWLAQWGNWGWALAGLLVFGLVFIGITVMAFRLSSEDLKKRGGLPFDE